LVYTQCTQLKIYLTRLNLRKQKKGLGNKLIIALNICDLFVCLISPVTILFFNGANRKQAELYKFVNETSEIETLPAEASRIFKTYRAYSVVWNLICYYPFQFLVQVSCFLTVLLSATRMVALLKPLYIIRQKIVWGALIIALFLLFSTKIVKWVALQAFFDSFVNEEMMVRMIKDQSSLDVKEFESSKIVILLETIDFILVGVMVLVVVVCCALTVRALNSPIVEIVGPGGLPDNSTNRRATVMVLLLSLVFIIINGTWITIYLTLAFEFLAKSLEDTKEILDMLQNKERDIAVYTINLVMMSVTSLINPLIYIARNTGLNEYTRSSLRRIGRMISNGLQGFGNAEFLPRHNH